MYEFKEVIVTLFEGHYHLGVASLINSLVKSAYKGLVRIGYKGALPKWSFKLVKTDDNFYKINNEIFLEFVHLQPRMHFGYYKPYFMRDTLERYPVAHNIFYFDPDIVVKAPWNFFSNWVDIGIALCLDISFPFVHKNHPWRNTWKGLSNSLLDAQLDFYVNSGFVGINSSQMILLDRWINSTEIFKKNGGNIDMFIKDGDRAIKTDQDILNAVLTVSPDLNLSVIGAEGMGFSQPAYLMSHDVSTIKPWKKNHIEFLIKSGRKPTFLDIDYLKNANYPIKVYRDFEYGLKKMNLRISSILGRIIG